MKPSTLRQKRLCPFTFLACAALANSTALAGNHTWDGGGADGSWLTGANWNDDPAGTPAFGTDSIQTFNTNGAGNLTTLIGTSPNIGTLAFNADADHDISIRLASLVSGGVARALVFAVTSGNAAINVDAGATGNVTLGVSDGSVNLSNNLLITHDGSGVFTIDRPINMTSPLTGLVLTKAGSGTLTLSAVNTFNGGVILNGGTLNLGLNSTNATVLGAAASPLTINGGTIDNTTATALNIGARPLTLNGDFAFKGSAGTLNLGTGATSLGTATGTSRNITVTAGTLTIAGIIADGTTATGITKSGSGVLTLSGKSTFTGPILVKSGSLSTASTATFASSGLTVGGATATGTPVLAGVGSLNIPVTIAAAAGGVVGTDQPGGSSVGTQTFTNTLTFGSGAIFSWQVNTGGTADPGANTANQGTYDKVVANGAAGSVTGGAAVFRIAIGGSAFTDAFWDTNKTWSDVFSGAGTPAALGTVFSGFAGTGIDANGYVTGQGQFTFVGSTLKWTAGATPPTAYGLWATGLANPAFDFDSDGDGIQNGLEWILGGNATHNDLPSILPAAIGNPSTGLTLNFTRKEDAIAETTLTLEYATDLSGPWTSEIIDQDGGSFGNGVTITIDQAPSPDAVTINIPASLAPGGKIFARLKAVHN